MKHPLWLVNCLLAALFFMALGFLVFSRQKLPKRITLKPKVSHATAVKKSEIFDVAQIYENDLFNTYHKVIAPPTQPDYSHPMPLPPHKNRVNVPEEPKQPFLPPLNITLNGIMVLNDGSGNCAIITDKKTNLERNYKVGDTLEDAQLIRIFYNRIVFIRSNGQQETLYINERDVEQDPAYIEEQDNWSHVAKKISGTEFLIDPEAFVKITRNLAQCIDMFDLTTVYKEGKSIGCRVGKISENSLGISMGLEPYDIITKINGIDATTTDGRFKIYKELESKTFNDEIKISVLQNEKTTVLTYKLHDLKDPLEESLKDTDKKKALEGIHHTPTEDDLEKERIELLRQKYKFASTKQDLMIQEKMNMLNGQPHEVRS